MTCEPLRLKDVADALLYLGPRDSLTQVIMPRAELLVGRKLARYPVGRPTAVCV